MKLLRPLSLRAIWLPSPPRSRMTPFQWSRPWVRKNRKANVATTIWFYYHLHRENHHLTPTHKSRPRNGAMHPPPRLQRQIFLVSFLREIRPNFVPNEKRTVGFGAPWFYPPNVRKSTMNPPSNRSTNKRVKRHFTPSGMSGKRMTLGR